MAESRSLLVNWLQHHMTDQTAMMFWNARVLQYKMTLHIITGCLLAIDVYVWSCVGVAVSLHRLQDALSTSQARMGPRSSINLARVAHTAVISSVFYFRCLQAWNSVSLSSCLFSHLSFPACLSIHNSNLAFIN